MQNNLEDIVRRFGAETGTIHRLEEGVLVLAAHIGIPPPVVEIVRRVPVGKGMAGLAAERNQPVSSCNIQTDKTGDVRPGAKATGVGGGVAVPAKDAAGRVTGVLGIGVQREHEYSADETSRLMEEASRLVASPS